MFDAAIIAATTFMMVSIAMLSRMVPRTAQRAVPTVMRSASLTSRLRASEGMKTRTLPSFPMSTVLGMLTASFTSSSPTCSSRMVEAWTVSPRMPSHGRAWNRAGATSLSVPPSAREYLDLHDGNAGCSVQRLPPMSRSFHSSLSLCVQSRSSASSPLSAALQPDDVDAFQSSGDSSAWDEEEFILEDDDSQTDQQNPRSDDSDNDDDDDDDGEFEDAANEILLEYQAWCKAVDSCRTAMERKRTSLQSELTKAQNVEGTVSRAQLLVSNLYMFTPGVKSVTVQDWENDGKEVTLTWNDQKYSTASEEADALFAQARKLKRGSQVVQDLLEDTAGAWDTLVELQQDLESLHSQDSSDIDEGRLGLIQDRLRRTSRRTNFKEPHEIHDPSSNKQQRKRSKHQKKPEMGTPASNVRKMQSPGGCTVLVGRNRRGNEYLSLNVARQQDVWMHSRGCPGAHVIVMHRRGGPTPTEACYQFAADITIFYSDFRTEEKAPVVSAQPKHLLKPRGAPLGAIKVREEWRTFVGRPDRVPQELKEAREESGQMKEYRNTDKAKHRKRTKKATSQAKQRRRLEKKQQQQQKTEDASLPDFY